MHVTQSRSSVESPMSATMRSSSRSIGRAMLLLDRAHQVGLGAEVVADRGVVALARGLADLPVRHGEDTMLGVQPLGCLQDRLLRAARPVGAHSSGRRHEISQPARRD